MTPAARTTTPLALALCLTLGAASCTTKASPTEPPEGVPSATTAVQALAAGLTRGSLEKVALDVTATQANQELGVIMGGMDGLRPVVRPGEVTYDHAAGTARARLDQELTLGSQAVRWSSTATLTQRDGAWAVEWKPSIVHDSLDGGTRLRHIRDVPRRAAITSSDGLALVEPTVAYRVGVDKAATGQQEWETTARTLAALVDVDADSYATKVAAAGAQAFVPALTLREGRVPLEVKELAGVQVVPVEIPLAPSATFAVGILGGASEAGAEIVKESHGDVLPGDVVGTSGLQKRYDAQLRGTVGHRLEVVRRSQSGNDAGPSPTPALEPRSSASPVVRVLHDQAARPGQELATSLDRNLQERAEQALAQQKGIASLVVLKVGSGDVLAAANSPAAGANPDATVGHYAPGSTFKVVTSLALLRKGLTPSSSVPCTATTTVNGRVFKNYTDFPASKVGTISLTDALAHSCNTSFLALHQKLADGDLAQAAASLGMGVDHDAGFSSFYGSVPASGDVVTRAANMIGQGTVEASPMAMAGVAASVASGKTVVPWLVATKKPTQTGAELTATEARQLQEMMRAVVSTGSGKVLAGQMDGAKTGTAEFGTDTPPRTHAWMIAWNDQLAVAAMVKEGASGSRTAAPLIKDFLAAG
ncbi:penicillin-binding transpeptidase domain-containing protein [Luteococcus sp. Sow4_B9]|uniref:penicillin-binding transpeptidase domain-containing protein n=1 Tax=Luteococcus sp. Sow4_B9 TaxID=3438792 RepID=UPI003F9EAF7A